MKATTNVSIPCFSTDCTDTVCLTDQILHRLQNVGGPTTITFYSKVVVFRGRLFFHSGVCHGHNMTEKLYNNV